MIHGSILADFWDLFGNMKEKKLKVFALPIEEFEKKYPVSYSIVVPGIPEGHVAKVVSARPC